jgi:hypothetical protein
VRIKWNNIDNQLYTWMKLLLEKIINSIETVSSNVGFFDNNPLIYLAIVCFTFHGLRSVHKLEIWKLTIQFMAKFSS